MPTIFLFALILNTLLFNPLESPTSSEYDKEEEYVVFENKTMPLILEGAVKEALAYFPELKETDITFEFRKNISGAVMQAQPRILSLFVDGKEGRKYRVKISRALEFGEVMVPIEEIPHDALVGWIGHELGHVMDYINRSSTNMMHFGAKYFLSKKKIIEAELTADGYAIGCGMGHQILANKDFILNNDGFEESYKDKIRNLYMSPKQILSLQEALQRNE